MRSHQYEQDRAAKLQDATEDMIRMRQHVAANLGGKAQRDAARAMLAALKDALSMLPAFPPHDPQRSRFDAIRNAIAAAEAAGIAAAEG